MFLSEPVVRTLAQSATKVKLVVGGTAVISTNDLAIIALRNKTSWHNGATFNGTWCWTRLLTSTANYWPMMYHSSGSTGCVHWLYVTGYNSIAAGVTSYSETWLYLGVATDSQSPSSSLQAASATASLSVTSPFTQSPSQSMLSLTPVVTDTYTSSGSHEESSSLWSASTTRTTTESNTNSKSKSPKTRSPSSTRRSPSPSQSSHSFTGTPSFSANSTTSAGCKSQSRSITVVPTITMKRTTSYSVSSSSTMSPSTTSSLPLSPSATSNLTLSTSATTIMTPSMSHLSTPSSTHSVLAFEPAIAQCVLPLPLYVNTSALIVVRGKNFAATDRFYVSTEGRDVCKEPWRWYNNRTMSAVWLAPTLDTAEVRFTPLTDAVLWLCVHGERYGIHFNLSCSTAMIPSTGPPPWSDAAAVEAIAAATKVSPNASVLDVNSQRCISASVVDGASLSSGASQAGPLLNSYSMTVQFGNNSRHIASGEMCLFHVPHLSSSVPSPVDSNPYEVTVTSSLSDSDDSPFLSFSAANVVNFTSLDVPATCTVEVSGMTAGLRFPAGEITVVRFPASPFMLLACSAVGDARGLMARMRYTRVDTVCSGNCKDGGGHVRGVCAAASGTCRCNDGFSGPSCSRAPTPRW